MTDVNDWLYMNILDPTARFLELCNTKQVREKYGNFFDNIFLKKFEINNFTKK